MDNSWSLVIEFLLLAIFIGIASFLKKRFKFFRKYLVPVPIIAGFIGLLFGPELLNFAPLHKEWLGLIVYHLMALGFIALSLQDRVQKKNKDIFNGGLFIVTNYLLQGIIGLLITLFFLYTIYPDIFPLFGLLLPLAYGQGPGQAFSIGTQWEHLGFLNGGNIGLTFATFGFIWASFAGLPLMNYLIRRKKFKYTKRKKHHPYQVIQQKIEYRESVSNESLDSLSIQLFLIAAIYFVTYLTIKVASSYLEPLGTIGSTLAQLLWGFHFLIGTLYGLLVRMVLNFLKSKNKKLYFDTDKFLLQRITGGVFDFMITASIAAISIYTLQMFAVPILAITTIGGLFTMIYIYFMGQKVFKEYHLENILGFYGMMTGTISTGMALLKEVDPNLETTATDNLVMGSAVAILFGFPLMVILSIPVIGYTTGQPLYYFYTLAIFAAYLGILYFMIFRNGRNKSSREEKTTKSI